MHHAPQQHFRAAPGPPSHGGHGGHHGGHGNGNANRAPLTTSASNHLTDDRFDALPLAGETHRALQEVLGFTHMTQVQAATLPVILDGSDVIAKAKTGTGKTMVRCGGWLRVVRYAWLGLVYGFIHPPPSLSTQHQTTQAFLIPCVEQLAKGKDPPRLGNISVLILSPTRELAQQIETEARNLLTFHQRPRALRCDIVYGGTNINAERKRVVQRAPDILVATPGRLIDHLENSNLGPSLSKLRVLILDEADQLLDMGFRPAIEKIIGYLPRDRQTLLFSATIPKGVQEVAGLALKKDHKFIDTVGKEDHDTNIQVRDCEQMAWAVVVGMTTMLPCRIFRL